MSKQGEPVTKFADIIAVKSADANGVLDAILEALSDSLELTYDEIKMKLIGCTFDGASVNQGIKGGVVAKLKPMIDHILVSIWCAPHKLELSIIDLIKDKGIGATVIGIVEKGVDPIYRFYYESAKRRREVNAIADVLEEDHVYFSAPSGTRWMASRKRAYAAVLQHYNAVICHMEEASHKKTEEGPKCVGYLKILKTRKFIEALVFMLQVLDPLSDVSEAFQRDDLMITDVSVKLTEAALKLERLKTIKPMYETLQTLITDNVYHRGEQFHKLSGNSFTDNDLSSFLTEAIRHIDDRFRHLRSTPLVDFEVFDARNMPNTLAELATYGDQEIENLIQHFGSVLTREETEGIMLQWPSLKASVAKGKHFKKPREILVDLLCDKPDELKHILVLVEIMMTLSPSSAAVERGFSKMKAIKTSRRNRMSNSTLSMMMMANHIKVPLTSYDPTPAVTQWMTVKQRRAIKGIKGPRALRSPEDVKDTGHTEALDRLLPQLAAVQPECSDIEYSSSGSEFDGF